MAVPRIGAVIGTTREGRFGDNPARWMLDVASARTDLDLEIADLRDYPLPLFDEVAGPAMAPPENEVALSWGEKMAEFDGYLFVTAEYNHGIPGALKNALDHAYPEFNRKPAVFVGYGGARDDYVEPWASEVPGGGPAHIIHAASSGVVLSLIAA